MRITVVGESNVAWLDLIALFESRGADVSLAYKDAVWQLSVDRNGKSIRVCGASPEEVCFAGREQAQEWWWERGLVRLGALMRRSFDERKKDLMEARRRRGGLL